MHKQYIEFVIAKLSIGGIYTHRQLTELAEPHFVQEQAKLHLSIYNAVAALMRKGQVKRLKSNGIYHYYIKSNPKQVSK
jgi:hypothetical protein